MKDTFYRRHNDDELIDRVTIDCVPRFKTSGLSGDEWRVSYVVRLYRKGHLMVENWYTRLRYAIAALPWVVATWTEGSDEDTERRWSAFLRIEDSLCHQVGCGEPATVIVKLTRLTSVDGAYIVDESSFTYLRAFCDRHATRGDSDREDNDADCVVVSGERRPYTGEVSIPDVVVLDASEDSK